MKHINPLLIGLLMTLLGIGNSWGAALDFPSADYHISGELHTLPGGQPKIYLSGSEKGASYVLYRDGQPISNQEGTGRSLLFLGDGTGTYTIAVETWKYPLFIKDSLKVTDFPGLEHIKSITRTKTEGPLKAEGGACWFDVILDSPVNKTVSQSLREISEICYQGRCSTWHPSYGLLITAYPAYPDKIRVVVMGKPNIGNEQYSFLQLGKTRLEVTQKGQADKLLNPKIYIYPDSITGTWEICGMDMQPDVVYTLYQDEGFRPHPVATRTGICIFPGLTQYGNYYVTSSYQGKTVQSNTVNLTYPFLRFQLSGDAFISRFGPATLKLSGSELEVTYRLYCNNRLVESQQGTGKALAFDASIPGEYYVVACKDGEETRMDGVSHVRYPGANSADYGHNFTIERTILAPARLDWNDDITYFDGFNRPLQEIQVDGSASTQSDLVTPHVYAAFGQEEKKYLPFVKQYNSGAFVADALNVINWNTYGTDEMAYAFSQTDYEASPLNRIFKQTGEGQAWHTREKGITYAYALNAANEVRRYAVSADGTLTRNGFYDAGTLQAVTTTDEDGHTSTTYTDNLGREVLLLQTDGKTRLETYKVYDGRGLLRWVLSPEAVAQLGEGTDAAVLGRLAYYYEYDVMEHTTLKQLPGCKPVYMTYDSRGRLVFSQDGNERDNNPRRWSYQRYDASGRVVESGEFLAKTDIGRLNMLSLSARDQRPEGTYTPLQQTVYDDYDNPVIKAHAFTATPGYESSYLRSAGGQVTSVRSRKLGTDEWQTITTYYDDHARSVQVVSDETGGGLLRICTAYDFVGNVIRTREQHADGSFIETNRTYDRRSRLLTISTTKDGGTPAVITYTYDELGRPVAKKYGNTTEQLRYNIRGWLTAKESAPFKMQLHYETPLAGTTPCYNGNVSEWTWTHEGHATLMYGFAYDGFSRLASATQKQRDGLTWTTPAASFTEKGITYDRNGNIRTLQRTACGKLVDDLLYAYSGNRLTALSEQVRTSQQGDVYQPGNAAAGSYEYDSNGNLTKDSRKALSFTYNRLNLTDEVKQGGVLKARYQYLTDGTKLSVRDGSGKNGYDYAGSFIYKVADGKREFDRAIVGDVQFTSQGTRYALTDQLGSIRALIDDKGKVVQQNDFYPFGAKAERDGLAQAEDNRFLFSGKECQALIDLNAYDFGARMYDASLGRWTAVDPLAEKYTNLSPYNYCINNPLVIVDPDGKDAIITIVGNTIIISLNIIFYGEAVNADLAQMYEMFLYSRWGSINSFKYEGVEYKVQWDINVSYSNSTLKPETDFNFNGVNNYMEVVYRKKGDERSIVIDCHHGTLYRDKVEVDPFRPIRSMIHEFGHFVGLEDRYVEGTGAPTSKEYDGNIMHKNTGIVNELNMKGILARHIGMYTMPSFFSPWLEWKSTPSKSYKPEEGKYHINIRNREKK